MMNALAKKLQSGADGGDQPAFRGIAASMIGMAGAPGFIISFSPASIARRHTHFCPFCFRVS
jgi:hypothetical protein